MELDNTQCNLDRIALYLMIMTHYELKRKRIDLNINKFNSFNHGVTFKKLYSTLIITNENTNLMKSEGILSF